MTSKNRSVPVDTVLPHVNSQWGERRDRESEPVQQGVSLLDFGLRRHSLPPGAFDNGDIAVDRKIGEGFHTFAGRRPANLQAIYCPAPRGGHAKKDSSRRQPSVGC